MLFGRNWDYRATTHLGIDQARRCLNCDYTRTGVQFESDEFEVHPDAYKGKALVSTVKHGERNMI